MVSVADSVTAVIVTYGDRSDLCVETARRAEACGVNRVVIVDNDSVPSSATQLLEWVHKRDDRILIPLPTNSGSAGGYHAGISTAITFSPKYIWLLDDDNWPDLDALQVLLHAQHRLGQYAIVSSSRWQKPNLQNHPPRSLNLAPKPPGSYLYFDLLYWLRSRVPNVKRRSHTEGIIPVPYAPYGGLLVDLDTLQRVGLPIERFFVYEDDSEYTWRMTLTGSQLYLVQESRIWDADGKWSAEYNGRTGPERLLRSATTTKGYHSIRNRVCFDYLRLNTPAQRIRLMLNKAIYSICVQLVVARNGELKQLLKAFRVAENDGRRQAETLADPLLHPERP